MKSVMKCMTHLAHAHDHRSFHRRRAGPLHHHRHSAEIAGGMETEAAVGCANRLEGSGHMRTNIKSVPKPSDKGLHINPPF